LSWPLPILQLTSASMAASFDSVLPRCVNLGTAVRCGCWGRSHQ
jgi:hypothetical protein